MRRLYFSIIVAVIGSLFLISWGLDSLVANHVEHEDSSDIILYKQLLEGLSKELNNTPNNAVEERVVNFKNNYGVQVSLKLANNVALPQSILAQLTEPGGLLLASDNSPYLLKTLVQHPNFLLQIQLPSELEDARPFDIILTSILYIGVCSIIILWLLPLTRRLYILTSIAEQIGQGNLALRVPTSKYSYIRSFEKSFNQMASQIEKLVTDNKILARSLSHDIRTPMSCLRFGVEAALTTTDVDKKNTYIRRMESELTRMEEMTSVFLEYAGMERQGFNLKKEVINLNDFLFNITQDFQSLAEQYNIILTFHPSEKEFNANIDEYWCQRAIQNLISNAVQYAKKQVHLTIQYQTNMVDITVSDDGKGIQEDKADVIFDPFVKLDSNRTRENGHFGLGLAICSKIMAWHQGRIYAKNSVHYGGASFTLSFPLKK